MKRSLLGAAVFYAFGAVSTGAGAKSTSAINDEILQTPFIEVSSHLLARCAEKGAFWYMPLWALPAMDGPAQIKMQVLDGNLLVELFRQAKQKPMTLVQACVDLDKIKLPWLKNMGAQLMPVTF